MSWNGGDDSGERVGRLPPAMVRDLNTLVSRRDLALCDVCVGSDAQRAAAAAPGGPVMAKANVGTKRTTHFPPPRL
jgi:hypothetical protein